MRPKKGGNEQSVGGVNEQKGAVSGGGNEQKKVGWEANEQKKKRCQKERWRPNKERKKI